MTDVFDVCGFWLQFCHLFGVEGSMWNKSAYSLADLPVADATCVSIYVDKNMYQFKITYLHRQPLITFDFRHLKTSRKTLKSILKHKRSQCRDLKTAVM